MIELTYTTADGRMSFKVTGGDQRDLFREIQRIQEVFEGPATAKIDGKEVSATDVRYFVRKSKYTDEKGKEKEAEYFEQRIISGPMAGYKKCFGILDDGTGGLFPKKAPDEDVQYGYNGWHKYIGNK